MQEREEDTERRIVIHERGECQRMRTSKEKHTWEIM